MNGGVISSTTARTLEERLEALRVGPAFRNYTYARDRVLEMRAQVAGAAEYRPSAYWKEELAAFEYMLDASPLVIEKLRQHTHWITGLRAYDYRSQKTRAKAKFEEKLKALIEVGPSELLVPEWPDLGGFGFDIEGRLFNIDTLKFFEVLIALEKGAVLQEFRGNTDRRLVWEIGAGWGGFPYHFKSLCPNVTYVISDFPELFLFSATYLMTAFPSARVAFWGEEPTDRLLDKWQDLDFIFMPNTSLAELKPERLDLAINMVSFQEMTDAQVGAYVERAFDLRCPFLYSLNRDKSAYNLEISSVSELISRHYWPREVSVLPVPYQKMMGDTPSAIDYKHLIGWRRVKVS